MYTERQWQEAEKRVREYLKASYPRSNIEIHRWEITGAIVGYVGKDGHEFYMDDLTKGLVQER